MDLGSIEAAVHRRARVGEPAPPFEVETIDGKPLRLSDFSGKYVLLEFWASWCGPCRGAIPELKELHERFAADGRLRILGLSVDEDRDAARKLVAKEGMPWLQGYLGKWSESEVCKAYGVPWLPHTVLVGPDGKVVGRNLDGPTLRAAIGELLSRPVSGKASR
jgi:thiol-disulfide isomerase/thioredoxin